MRLSPEQLTADLQDLWKLDMDLQMRLSGHIRDVEERLAKLQSKVGSMAPRLDMLHKIAADELRAAVRYSE